MTPPIEILDIRCDKSTPSSSSVSIPNLYSLLIQGLSQTQGNRTIPSEVLYDTVGLELYNHGLKTDWPESGYYPIVAERQILDIYGDEVAGELTRDSEGRAIIIELGAGSLEKTAKLLTSLANQVSPAEPPLITYYALDIDHPSVQVTLSELQSQSGPLLHQKVATKGMWGTFEDAFEMLKNPAEISSTLHISPEVPIHIMLLGGTIGNFAKGQEDVSFLRSGVLNKERGDRWILGADRKKDRDMMERAYGEHGRPWMMHGLRVVGRVLGDEGLFEVGKWDKWAKYNDEKGRVEMGYRVITAHTMRVPGTSLEIEFAKDEIVMVMFSNKYTEEEINSIFKHAGVGVSKRWMDKEERYWLFSLCAASS